MRSKTFLNACVVAALMASCSAFAGEDLFSTETKPAAETKTTPVTDAERSKEGTVDLFSSDKHTTVSDAVKAEATDTDAAKVEESPSVEKKTTTLWN